MSETADDQLDAEIESLRQKIAEAKAHLPSKTTAETPLSNGPDGRFLPGNKVAKGRGNPLAGEVAKRRAAMFAAISVEDFQSVVAKVLELAKRGNIAACKEILDRILGRPVEADLIDKLEELEAQVTEIIGRWQQDAQAQGYRRITTH